MPAVASADPIRARGVAAVSGAAGAIGRAVVSKLVERDLVVLALDRDGAALTNLVKQREGWVLPIPGELPSAEVLDLLEKTLGQVGMLHHTVAIAGGATPGELVDNATSLDVASFRGSIEANLVSAWAFIHTCLPWMVKSAGDRSITFCSSRNALAGHGLPAYSAAKAGLHGLLHPLAVELGAQGVRVNAVAPGQIATPFARAYHAAQPGHFERIAASSSLGRLATEEDVAAAFTALALDLHGVTGQTIVVDAGAHIWRGA